MDSAQKMNEIQGAPIKIVIGGKEIEVKKLSIKAQLELMDKIVAQKDPGDKPSGTIAFMIDVVAAAAKISPEELDEKGSLSEIPDAFAAIWKQNGFDFLLQKVRSLKGLMSLQAAN